jgi:hypothetical protein
MKIESSSSLDFKNILSNPISLSNMIIKPNLAILIPDTNQYYLVQHMNIKYLLNRTPQMLSIIQINNRQHRIVKNKEIFKLGSFDYLLTNQASIIVPMEQKRYFNNHYGTSYQTFMPRV